MIIVDVGVPCLLYLTFHCSNIRNINVFVRVNLNVNVNVNVTVNMQCAAARYIGARNE